jgi:hypothetical protein
MLIYFLPLLAQTDQSVEAESWAFRSTERENEMTPSCSDNALNPFAMDKIFY